MMADDSMIMATSQTSQESAGKLLIIVNIVWQIDLIVKGLSAYHNG